MLRRRKANTHEYVSITNIRPSEWQKYFTKIYKENEEHQTNDEREETQDTNNFQVEESEVSKAIKEPKNRKAPGEDKIPNELIKYAGKRTTEEITKLFNKILKEGEIPKEWRRSITFPIFKKGNKKDPSNYRGITLLSSIMKLFVNA